jgi:hypothetical protein
VLYSDWLMFPCWEPSDNVPLCGFMGFWPKDLFPVCFCVGWHLELFCRLCRSPLQSVVVIVRHRNRQASGCIEGTFSWLFFCKLWVMSSLHPPHAEGSEGWYYDTRYICRWLLCVIVCALRPKSLWCTSETAIFSPHPHALQICVLLSGTCSRLSSKARSVCPVSHISQVVTCVIYAWASITLANCMLSLRYLQKKISPHLPVSGTKLEVSCSLWQLWHWLWHFKRNTLMVSLRTASSVSLFIVFGEKYQKQCSVLMPLSAGIST